MKKLFFLSLVLVTATAVSCKTVKDDSDTTASLNFETIHSSALMGGGSEGIEESIVVCNAEIDLFNIKQKMNSVNYSTQELDKMEIDFEMEDGIEVDDNAANDIVVEHSLVDKLLNLQI